MRHKKTGTIYDLSTVLTGYNHPKNLKKILSKLYLRKIYLRNSKIPTEKAIILTTGKNKRKSINNQNTTMETEKLSFKMSFIIYIKGQSILRNHRILVSV